MKNNNNFKKLKYTDIKVETVSAILFLFNKMEVWLPKSRIVVYKLHKQVEIETWLYAQKFGG